MPFMGIVIAFFSAQWPAFIFFVSTTRTCNINYCTKICQFLFNGLNENINIQFLVIVY